MDNHDSLALPVDSSLPRPVVLSPEDLASVAAAGMSLATTSVLGARILIAGGIPALPTMGMAF